MDKTSHIMSGAASLLSISLALVAGLKITGSNGKTFADEIGGGAALFFALACALSYLAIRAGSDGARWEKGADGSFILGLATLVVSVGVLVSSNLS
ncbi:hypothetical protein BH09PSE4_BH09PSE4_09940 [soil metagenome]